MVLEARMFGYRSKYVRFWKQICMVLEASMYGYRSKYVWL